MKTCDKRRFFSMCDSIAFHNSLLEPISIIDDCISKVEDTALTKKVNRLVEINKERLSIIEDLENEWKKHPKFDKAMFMGFQR